MVEGQTFASTGMAHNAITTLRIGTIGRGFGISKNRCRRLGILVFSPYQGGRDDMKSDRELQVFLCSRTCDVSSTIITARRQRIRDS
jgi:hypothetical protein|tara:strand:- start:397 stop:657 length:261 start_codon:yes stop_codon:yes gene_type:complete